MRTPQLYGEDWGTAPHTSLARSRAWKSPSRLQARSLFRQRRPQLGFQRGSFPKRLSSLLHRVASCSRLSPGASLLPGSVGPGQATHMYLVRGGQHQSRRIWPRQTAHCRPVTGKVHVRTGPQGSADIWAVEVAGGRVGLAKLAQSLRASESPCWRLAFPTCIGQRGRCSAFGGGLRREIASGPTVENRAPTQLAVGQGLRLRGSRGLE